MAFRLHNRHGVVLLQDGSRLVYLRSVFARLGSGDGCAVVLRPFKCLYAAAPAEGRAVVHQVLRLQPGVSSPYLGLRAGSGIFLERGRSTGLGVQLGTRFCLLSGRGGGGTGGNTGGGGAAIAARLRSFGLINLTLPTNAVWYII